MLVAWHRTQSMWQQLKQLLTSNAPIPERWRDKQWNSLSFLAIDLELTSLDAEQSRILSIGWVESKGCQIDLGSCFYNIINTKSSLNQSPVIHGLVEEDIVQGERVQKSLSQLSSLADSHIWVFHNTALDMQVLTRTYQKLGIVLPPVMTIDTLQIALYLLHKQQSVLPPNAATLTACRQRYRLPLAPAHNALDDAMATLELLHALLFQLDPKGVSPLKDFSGVPGFKLVPPDPQ